MGQIVFQATLGGQVAVAGPNTASSFTLTLPAATDTLVGKATTDTLTNKTLTSPTITGATLTTSAFNGTVGATTPSTGAFTTLTASTGANFATTSGSVGIGITSPTAKLQLGDGSSGQLKFRIHRGAGTDYTEYYSNGGSTAIDTVGGGDFQFLFGGTEKVRITGSNGYLGIGTTTATRRLQVGSGAGDQKTAIGQSLICLAANSGNLGYVNEVGFGGNNETNVQSAIGNIVTSDTASGNGALYFATRSVTTDTAPTERMRITSAGNLLVGTTSAIAQVHVLSAQGNNGYGGSADTGMVLIQSTGTSGGDFNASFVAKNYYGFGQVMQWANLGMRIGSRGTANGGAGEVIFTYGNDSEGMRISSSGIVTMSAYGAGAATFSAAGVISSVSDETWKTKDGVPTNPDAMLQKLDPGYWFYNEEKAPTYGEERQLGFYAQNVHEAIGEEAAPTPQEGKPWGYHDRSVLAIAVMSLKNALNTIEELKQRITVLENK